MINVMYIIKNLLLSLCYEYGRRRSFTFYLYPYIRHLKVKEYLSLTQLDIYSPNTCNDK